MPNWCSTNIDIYSSPDEITVLRKEFIAAAENGKIKNGFGKGWFGHLLEHLGMPEEEIINGAVSCRGSIEYSSLEDNGEDDRLHFETETAWSPMLEVFTKFCERYAPDAYIEYTAVEPGMALYLTNDESMIGSYLVDVYGDDCPEGMRDMYEYLTEHSLHETLKDALGIDDSLDKLLEIMSERYEDVSIHQFELCDIEDCC